MKKKILIAVIGVICLLSMVLAGCSNIKIDNVDNDVIKVLQDAIKHSENDYQTYYIRERWDTDPKNMASNERTEYMLNYQADDKSITGVDNTKVHLSIKYTQGITEYTDSFIFGKSLSKKVKPKNAKPEDYKLAVFKNYKTSKTSPAFTRNYDLLNSKEDIFNYVTPHDNEKDKVALKNYTMKNVLKDLAELTKDDIKMAEKGNKKQGKVSTYVFEVTKEGHKYHFVDSNNKPIALEVMIYTEKGVSRIMSVTSADEKYTLDVMYQGPKIDIPVYDKFNVSDNIINIISDRKDGLIGVYAVSEKPENKGEFVFDGTINPLQLAETEITKTIKNSKGKDEKITYTYQFTTVESAVNWSYEYTEVTIRLLAWDKAGDMYELEDENEYLDETFFIKTSTIEKKKDMSSMIPMAAAIVAVIALLVALMALFKIKKQNKELTKKIKALSGETDEEEIIVDAVVEETNADSEDIAKAENIEAEEVVATTEETAEAKEEVPAVAPEEASEKPAKKTKTKKAKSEEVTEE